MPYTAKFINKTDYKTYLSTWVLHSCGLNKYTEIEVEPGKEVVLTSVTGEWDVNDYFYDDNISRWHNCGYKRCEYNGKFGLIPCINGRYSWMENGHNVVYDGDSTFTKL
jgi:hypothetical protein